MHHLARHSVACFLTRGDLVHDFVILRKSFYLCYFSFPDISYLFIFSDSLFIGKKDVMFLKGF
jgi:hypothetical protein